MRNPFGRWGVTLILIGLLSAGMAQEKRASLKQLRQYEDSLQLLGTQMVEHETGEIRKMKCYDFIPTLVKALKVDHSFSYPFDSLDMISILYPKDRSFRIFSWGVALSDGSYRYFGCIQMNTDSLILHPLYDQSDFFNSPEDTVVDNKAWFGAEYYRIMQKQVWFQKYYYLFGKNRHDNKSTKKVMDVLRFEDGKPLFGAPRFVFAKKDTKLVKKRIVLQYKSTADVTLNYSEERGIVIYDYLAPLHKGMEGYYPLYVPDGTYEGLNYKWGKWHHINRVFHKTYEEPPGGK